MHSPTPAWAQPNINRSYTITMLKPFLFAVSVSCLLFLVMSCSPTVYLTNKSYAVPETIQTSIGSEMLEISKIKKADEGLQALQALSGGPVDKDYHFRVTLTYTGKSGSVVKVSYREYAGDLARPAYSLDLEYDLDESSSMNFRSLKMEVIEATNESITFVIVDDGGLPWLPTTL